jgi:hypothetical protein
VLTQQVQGDYFLPQHLNKKRKKKNDRKQLESNQVNDLDRRQGENSMSWPRCSSKNIKFHTSKSSRSTRKYSHCWGCGSMGECFPATPRVLGSIPGHKERKRGRRGGGEREERLKTFCQDLLTNPINRILFKFCIHQYPKTILPEK